MTLRIGYGIERHQSIVLSGALFVRRAIRFLLVVFAVFVLLLVLSRQDVQRLAHRIH
jgi:large-conductance mechanosensitive channel